MGVERTTRRCRRLLRRRRFLSLRLRLGNSVRNSRCTMTFSVASRIQTTTRLFSLVSMTSSGLTSIASPLGTFCPTFTYTHIRTYIHIYNHICFRKCMYNYTYYTDPGFRFVSLVIYIYIYKFVFTHCFNLYLDYISVL